MAANYHKIAIEVEAESISALRDAAVTQANAVAAGRYWRATKVSYVDESETEVMSADKGPIVKYVKTWRQTFWIDVEFAAEDSLVERLIPRETTS